MIAIRPLPRFVTGLSAMASLRSRAWPIWFDSGQPAARGGRYDLCMAEPTMTLVSVAGEGTLKDASGRLIATTREPLALLRALLAERRVAQVPLPFCGGAAGYFSYDLGLQLENAAVRERAAPVPDMAVGFYDWAVISDHQEGRAWWVGRSGAADAYDAVREWLAADAAPPAEFALDAASLTVMPEWDAYCQAFERVQGYLHAGDCYQVNLARRFGIRYRGDPWGAYLRLREISPAPFGAYLSLPFADILSTSPERFLALREGRVETRPIKGTRPRRQDPAADRAEREALRNSPKDRAENVMIVDLLRNDLGKVCRTGSVQVDALFELESYASVHHLVSSIRGELREGVEAADLLQACLPGGSITGAPKRRAMQIIDELEPQRRGVYCGAIGYISDDGDMDTNIAIRTAVCAGGEMSYWAGGGLVADSVADAEFEETMHKAAPLLKLIDALQACG